MLRILWLPLLMFSFEKLYCQKLPSCVEILKSDTAKNKLIQYNGVLRLKSGENVYRVKVIRRERCIDCNSGVYYMDSLCQRVASFLIGNGPFVYIKQGYNQEDFMEANNPMFAAAIKRDEQKRGLFFKEERRFSVKLNYDTAFALFRQGDEIRISNKEGMRHYINGKLKNSYKIIPYQLAASNSGANYYKVYYVDALKRFMYITDIAGAITFYLTRKEHEEHGLRSFEAKDWLLALKLQ